MCAEFYAFYRTKLPIITVRVRTSVVSTDGDVLEISNVVVHPNFDKYVYFNDIALIKVRIFVDRSKHECNSIGFIVCTATVRLSNL